MIENRLSVSASAERLQTGAEAPWIRGQVPGGPDEVREKRILIAEDDEAIRAWVRMVLELEGHQVTEASNGAEALKLFKAGEFDLVITDFEMPVMQGNTLAIGIKLVNPSLPILMITGSGCARRDGRNPVDALLSKPFTTADLRSALGTLLRGQTELPQPSAPRTSASPSERFDQKEAMVAYLTV